MALPAEDPSPAPGLGSVLLRLLLALVLVGGLIFLTVWGLKTLWEKRGWGITGDESKPVKVLATTYLAPRRAVYLLEVGKRILVVGAGNNEMNCLDVVTDPAEVESLRLAAQQGFPKMFSRVLQRQETATQQDEAKRILEESKQVVGGYVEKLKGASPRRKDRPRDPEDEA